MDHTIDLGLPDLKARESLCKLYFERYNIRDVVDAALPDSVRDLIISMPSLSGILHHVQLLGSSQAKQ